MNANFISIFLIFTTLFAHFDAVYYAGEVQSLAIRGHLKCNSTEAADVKVKLYDVNTLMPDDLMTEGHTDGNGHFMLTGRETEIAKLNPKLNIYHKCRDPSALCHQKIAIVIPSAYTTKGAVMNKIFDIGTVALNEKHNDESTDCLN